MSGYVVRVVIPVHDEEVLLGSCLDSVSVAMDAARAHPLVAQDPDAVRAVVVLDRCSDRSAEIAARYPAVTSIACHAGQVGAARALGARIALAQVGAGDALAGALGVPGDALAAAHGEGCAASALERVWLAHTDADTVVPADWLTRQVELACSGVQMVVGMADPVDLAPELHDAVYSSPRGGEGHHHVYGANLGLRADAYVAAGGFMPMSVHEDVDLVRRVRELGVPTLATARTTVWTSGRLEGRTPGGLSGYLSDLAESVTAERPAG